MLKVLLLLPLLLCGCFRTGTNASDPDLYRERIGTPRTERQLAKKEIVLALFDDPRTEKELSAVRRIAEGHQLKLTVLRLSSREALPPVLRAGRADLIAGGFTPDEIRRLRLGPVGGSSEDDSSYCFGARRDDGEIAELFGSAPNILPSGEMPETAKERKTSP